ncbi:tetratricopeptide repeat protein, partial [Candidatus Woesebacteria bacterium]|nr:tetratricopeptide repeat protein [Candidatus Woesebacteria bacterium]
MSISNKIISITLVFLILLGILLSYFLIFSKKESPEKRYQAGLTLYSEKQYVEAIEVFNSIIKHSPQFTTSDPSIYYNLGLAYLYTEKPYRAGGAFSEFLERETITDQITSEMMYIMASTFADSENYYAASNLFSEVNTADLGEAFNEDMYKGYLAQIAYEKKNSARAQELAQILIEAHPSNDVLLKALAIEMSIDMNDIEYKDFESDAALILQTLQNTDSIDSFTSELITSLHFSVVTEGPGQEKFIDTFARKAEEEASDSQISAAFNTLGQLYRSVEDGEHAVDSFKKAIKHDPDNMRAFLNLGNLYMDSNQPEQALEYYDKALNIDPSHPIATYALAWGYYNLGKYDQAVENVKNSIKANPEYELSENLLGMVYDKLKEPDKALEHFKKALDISPEYKKPYLNISAVYLQRNEYEPAIEWLEKALAIDPNYALAHNNLGSVYRRQDLYQEALDEFLKAIELDPTLTETYERIVEVYIKLDNLPQAKKYLEKGKATNIDFNFNCIEVDLYEADGNIVLSKLAQQQCVSRDPTREAQVEYDAGMKAFQRASYDEAIRAFKKSIEIDSSFISSYVMLGQSYSYLGKYDDSIAILRSAVDLDPGKLNTHLTLGSIYHLQKDYQNATETFIKALEIDPKSDIAWENLGLVYYDAKDFPKAQQAFETSIELNSMSVNHWINLGQT